MKCANCGHPERWHQTETQITRKPLTHCNELDCRCSKYVPTAVTA